jgi:predicted AAA+ superfamily ATPase
MLDILKEIILDFQEQPLNTGIPRNLELTPIPGKAAVCIGVRRSGKSTFMLQQVKKLLDSGVSPQNFLYLNFFDDRLHHLQHDRPAVILEAFFSLYPEKKNTEKIYCFFDEIQVIPGWEPFVDRVMRTENSEVYITGSSARMLSKEIATQMRGRALSWELFPFSFHEFLAFKKLKINGSLSTKKRLLVQQAFDEYRQSGGFPEVAGLNRTLRIKIHQEYFNATLFRDLVERHNISHPKAVIDLAHRLMDNIASLYSINKLTNYLQSLGHRAPKSAVSDYLAWFEDAFFLFTVRIFDASLTRTNSNPKKIYCVDHAMVTSVSSSILVNAGHLLENLVFMALRRITPDIFYYKNKGGKEVDFIALLTDGSRLLVQVCESMAAPKTRKREISALSEAMDELKINAGTIVTRTEEEQIEVASGVIEVVPAYRFLLNLPDCAKE